MTYGIREQAREGAGTIASQIRINLADAIISGRLAPGAEIDEQELADRFGASRTPYAKRCASWPPQVWSSSSRGAARVSWR